MRARTESAFVLGRLSILAGARERWRERQEGEREAIEVTNLRNGATEPTKETDLIFRATLQFPAGRTWDPFSPLAPLLCFEIHDLDSLL